MTHDTDPTPNADAPYGASAHQPHTEGTQSPHDAAATEAEATAQGATETGAETPDRIAELEAEVAAMREKWVRAEAEMQNLRTRTKREIEDARQYATQKFARDVVEAAENLKRALASLPAPTEDEDGIIKSMREGIESTERSFIGILERNGIVAVDAQGKPFDANQHQAMAEQHSDEHPAGTVMQAWTPAWTLHGRLLKPAMVVVSKGQA
ncbi:MULTISPECIES: nucleotide exchange factor GrpE [Novacetimonas]|uniref:Protein GrpE n=2 Tax=Novacetimonas hansenii TaxID=436 RepID=A0AAW5ERB9_NOVHA|nr:nucleotide exchange factor GrpE [Novacetimonas hansenii]EFG85805.1 chaperone binding protein [Novacetimonas hansenii ATCC 23769]MCJ8354362.1 nucleotide exchange factor GrpE [Novacetimonas hansenii]PYD73779.1 nucleotide exchange factor GrpE [Novacetimonas hansenii]RFP04667.1 nucleotide exchange factor GrpE [Novacetimonas hansenii]WEQ58090.1 nucleotide exchange factor GrpE [Novacetimonas hansenii]